MGRDYFLQWINTHFVHKRAFTAIGVFSFFFFFLFLAHGYTVCVGLFMGFLKMKTILVLSFYVLAYNGFI